MSSSPENANSKLQALRDGQRQLRRWWAALPSREQRLLGLAGALLGLFLLWSLAVAPAWHTLRTAPPLLSAGENQQRLMQALADEAQQLRAVAPVPLAQAQQALSAASVRLGDSAKLSLQGERAVLTLKGISGEQLKSWLAEARAGARARVLEAALSQTSPGLYDGSLTLALGSGP